MTGTLRIDAPNRWDALALARKLGRYHWFLVEPDGEHCDVCIVLDELPEGVPNDLQDRIDQWLDERRLVCTYIVARPAA